MKRTLQLVLQLFLLLALSAPAWAQTTWFIRPNGGTRYDVSANPTGQCNGKADAAYPGSGTNQPCAFQELQFLWDTSTIGGPESIGWVIAGGDTVVVRGCQALSGQVNPANPDCRIGWSAPTGGANVWCNGVGNQGCFNPTIPAGTSGAHTRFLAGCAYDATPGPCNSGNSTIKTNLTQLYSGYGLTWAIDLSGTSYVDFDGFYLTTHNDVVSGTFTGQNCTSSVGTPAFPTLCQGGSQPYDDYGQNGFKTNNTTAHITFQDMWIDGMSASGLHGPIGGPITMTRMNVNFNAFAAWNFDDGSNTPDGAGSSITASYVTMDGNGCYEQYPIVNAFPARVCYDTNSAGFGDSWSGQDTTMVSFSCDHCVDNYNTKDGFIGPHTDIATLSITNSTSIGNMGQDWKWGGVGGSVNNTTFSNNLTVGNCNRMSQTLPGAPSNYNQYLSGFCRAAGNVVASVIPTGSTWNIINNTFVSYMPTMFDIACPLGIGPCTSTVNVKNNIFLGYVNASQPAGGAIPAMYFIEDASITLAASFNVEFGMRNGTCPGGTGMQCLDPLFVSEPAQGSIPPESTLDSFNFNLTGSSPAITTGTTPCITPDAAGNAQTSPCTMGALVMSTPVAATPTFSPVAGTYSSTQSVTLSTTSGTVICYNTTGSPATNGTTGCTTGTLYTTPVSVSTSETLYAVAGGTGLVDSTVGSAAYVITSPTAAAPTFSPVAGSYTGNQSVTLATATGGCGSFINWNTTGAQSGGNLTGTTLGTVVTVASSETVYAQVQSCSGFLNSTIASAAYVIAVVTPTCTPPAGTYSSTQSVTCSSTDIGSTTYCTIDGTTPTTGSPVCTAISVASSLTLKAISAISGNANSAILTQVYTITAAPQITIQGPVTLIGSPTLQ